MQSSSPERERSGSQAGADGAVRPWLRNTLIGCALLAAVSLAMFLRKGDQHPDSSGIQASAPSVPDSESQDSSREPARGQQTSPGRTGNDHIVADSAPLQATKPAPAAKPEPSAHTRQLVASLYQLNTPPGAMTTEQRLQWTLNWHALVEQGGAAVPAILEFLEKNLDYGFGASGREALGHTSARAAMFEALIEIGGTEGLGGLLQVLQTTADPREIALLAQRLEKLAPEQYRQEAVNAAAQALAMAANGKLPGTDVAPLFQVLQTYGGAGAVSELEQAAKNWNYYATMGLARLPDGAGVPALIQMAQGNTGARGNALEMLAQVSPQYPDARAALVELARANKIGPNQWPYLTPMLAGDHYHYQDDSFRNPSPLGDKRPVDGAGHVRFGNQSFHTVSGLANETPEQLNQRRALLDELQAATTNPAALQALQAARTLLESRMIKVLTARSLPQQPGGTQ